jgi:hypothetical protein
LRIRIKQYAIRVAIDDEKLHDLQNADAAWEVQKNTRPLRQLSLKRRPTRAEKEKEKKKHMQTSIEWQLEYRLMRCVKEKEVRTRWLISSR